MLPYLTGKIEQVKGHCSNKRGSRILVARGQWAELGWRAFFIFENFLLPSNQKHNQSYTMFI
jgi:hypothetical protein